MTLQIRRGTNSERTAKTFASGEPVWTTDSKKLYVGDGTTQGGIAVGGVTGIVAGSNISVNTSTGEVTISSTAVGGVTSIIAGSNISVNTSTGAVTISSTAVGGVTSIIAGQNVSVNTSTGAVTVSSTSTYYNLTATNKLDVGVELSFGTGTNRMLWGQSPPNFDNQFYITGQSGNTNNKLFFDQWAGGVQFNSVLNPNNHIIPVTNNAVDLGSPSKKFRHLYVSSSTIYFDDQALSINADNSLTLNGNQVGSTLTSLTVATTATVATLAIGDTASSKLNLFKDSSVFRVVGENSGDSLRVENLNYVYLNPQSAVIINENTPAQSFLNVNTIRPSGTYTAVTVASDLAVNTANTMTVAGMTIGVSNSVLIPNVILSSSTNVLVQTPPTSGGHIIFGMNRFGLQRPLAITRTGGIAFDFGQQIFPGQGAGVGSLNIQAASTSTGTVNQLFLSSGGITGSGPLTRGIFNDASGFTIGTRTSGGATAFNSSVFDLHGGLTLPKSLAVGTTATVNSLSVTNTATVNNLSVTNTATANEVVVGADLKAIKSQGFNVIGVDGNWRVGNVLEVGSGSGSGYITSVGSQSLLLQTSDNDGPGGSISIGNGDGAGVGLYSGNSQEFSVATFNTTSNTINYGLTVNGPTTFNSITTLAVFTASALTAITGSVGQIAIVSNSAGGGNPNGMMAFWDTTNSRWSYVHDNAAV